VPGEWLKSLKEEESKHNPAAVLCEGQNRYAARPDEKPEPPITRTDKTDKKPRVNLPAPITRTDKTDKNSGAEYLGLVAAWSGEFGFISMHDPTSGEWHDLHWKDAPGWARWEARERKELYRKGNRKAHRLTSREMAQIEAHPIEEGD
jgi:hypothetical protein